MPLSLPVGVIDPLWPKIELALTTPKMLIACRADLRALVAGVPLARALPPKPRTSNAQPSAVGDAKSESRFVMQFHRCRKLVLHGTIPAGGAETFLRYDENSCDTPPNIHIMSVVYPLLIEGSRNCLEGRVNADKFFRLILVVVRDKIFR